jgi:hypothetical protein
MVEIPTVFFKENLLLTPRNDIFRAFGEKKGAYPLGLKD